MDQLLRRLVTLLFLLVPLVLGGRSILYCAPIHQAAKYGDLAKLQRLLTDNPRLVNARNEYQQTPLHLAASSGNQSIVHYLLDKGANVNATCDMSLSPLHVAAMGNRTEVARLLIASGAKVNAKDREGDTPLHGACDPCSYGGAEVAELLISCKAGIGTSNNEGETPLHLAASGKHVEIAKLLLSKGANINARDKEGKTPLHNACIHSKSEEMVRLLVENKANVNARDKSGSTPLHSAVIGAANLGAPPEIVEFLVSKGADPTNKNEFGVTPLWLAKEGRDKTILRMLEPQQIELLEWRWSRKSEDFIKVEGLVKNISDASLKSVEAVVTFYAVGDRFVTSESALIEYNPVLSGQASPFDIIVNNNPAIFRGEIEFKFLTGGTINTRYSEKTEKSKY